MSILSSPRPARRIVPSAAVLLALLALACAEAGGDAGGNSAAIGAADSALAPVDPCALLTNEEISEELYLAASPWQRETWTTREFEVVGSVAEWGETRACEYRFETRQMVNGTPAWQSEFTVVVSPAHLVIVPESERVPVPGGAGVFRAGAEEGAYYVIKGDYAASFRNLPARSGDDGFAGRIALLRRISERLP